MGIEQWQNFFVMVGGGAAALAGLVFIAMSMNLSIIHCVGYQRDQKRAACLLLPRADCRRKAGLLAEITLDGLQLSVLDSEILHIPERFTVLGVAKILHESIVRAGGDSLQVKMSDEIDLSFPAARFEGALADVVVASRAGKGEVIGEQVIHRAPVFRLPGCVPLPDYLLVR
jgi:hypothetical protein